MDFVTFEIATLLREKGYPQASRETNYIGRKYSPDGELTSAPYANGYACPTLSETLRWLRETHNIDITITVGLVTIDGTKVKKYFWTPVLFRAGLLTYPMNFPDGSGEEMANTYEEACEAAIKYCLTNLV